MRTFIIFLILFYCLFDSFGQNRTAMVPSNHGQYLITADYTISENNAQYSNFRLYKMPLDCKHYIKINLSYPIYWSADDSFFVCNDNYSEIPKIKIFNTQGFIVDSIINANCPFIYGKGIYYYFYDINKEQYPYSTIMYYDLLIKKKELIYKFDKDYSFDMESFGMSPLIWENNWPSGLLGRIFLKGDEANTYTFLINDKKLVYWIKGDYTKNRYLPQEGLIK